MKRNLSKEFDDIDSLLEQCEGGSAAADFPTKDDKCCCCFPLECGMTFLSWLRLITSTIQTLQWLMTTAIGAVSSLIAGFTIACMLMSGSVVFFLARWAAGECKGSSTKESREHAVTAYLLMIFEVMLTFLFGIVTIKYGSDQIESYSGDDEAYNDFGSDMSKVGDAAITGLIIAGIPAVYVSYYFYL